MILIASAIKHHRLQIRLERSLGDCAAARGRRGEIAPALQCAGDFLIETGRADERASRAIIDQLRIDVRGTPINVQAGPRDRAIHTKPHALVPSLAVLFSFVCLHSALYLPVFPSLRMRTSPAYLIPLALYTSGGLRALMSAAVWPTSVLFTPLIVTMVCLSTFASMPSGKG